ncbi:MAG: DUF6624 domain-containing protein [Planctomycetota bacterium]
MLFTSIAAAVAVAVAVPAARALPQTEAQTEAQTETQAETVRCELPELRAELVEMQRLDQEARNGLIELVQSGADQRSAEFQTVIRKAVELDRKHAARLKAIIGSHGWPTKTLVAEDGAFAAWLIAQHADFDPAFQQRCLELMKPHVGTGEIDDRNWAMLTDRVLLAKGEKQRFGTQLEKTPDGSSHRMRPCENPETVDRRRAEVGLPPIAVYIASVNDSLGRGG